LNKAIESHCIIEGQLGSLIILGGLMTDILLTQDRNALYCLSWDGFMGVKKMIVRKIAGKGMPERWGNIFVFGLP